MRGFLIFACGGMLVLWVAAVVLVFNGLPLADIQEVTELIEQATAK